MNDGVVLDCVSVCEYKEFRLQKFSVKFEGGIGVSRIGGEERRGAKNTRNLSTMITAASLALRGKTKIKAAAGLAFVTNHFSTSSNPERLAGKVAVITGGASGIGKAAAAEFVRNGARVVIADVQDDLGRAVAAELGADAACYTRCDVTDEAQVAAAVDLAIARHGKLDVMFNNAGVGGDMTPAPLGSIELDDFDRVMAVNARGVLAGVMVPRRSGSIICTASIAGVVGGVGITPYRVSKAAVLGLVRAVAAEMGRSGVRVNAISPSIVPTPLVMASIAHWFPGRSGEEHRRMVEVDMGMMDGLVLEAEDIARAALYLASDEAKYVNGHNLVVDGGLTVSQGGRNVAAGTPRE